MIDFLVNLALNLAPKTHQKSTQEAPKIYKKGIGKLAWNLDLLGMAFGGFKCLDGRQVGRKLAPKTER